MTEFMRRPLFAVIVGFLVAQHGGLAFLQRSLPATHFAWHGGSASAVGSSPIGTARGATSSQHEATRWGPLTVGCPVDHRAGIGPCQGIGADRRRVGLERVA